MGEVGVVQFLGDVQEHAVQPFLEGQFAWENNYSRVVLINDLTCQTKLFYISKAYCVLSGVVYITGICLH